MTLSKNYTPTEPTIEKKKNQLYVYSSVQTINSKNRVKRPVYTWLLSTTGHSGSLVKIDNNTAAIVFTNTDRNGIIKTFDIE